MSMCVATYNEEVAHLKNAHAETEQRAGVAEVEEHQRRVLGQVDL